MARLTISPSLQTFFPQTFLTKAYETAILTTTAGNFVTKAFFKEHVQFMRKALEEARKAGKQGEVPVGAILIDHDQNILSKGRNECIRHNDPTAHAEIVAIRKAASLSKNYRLLDTTLYVTIEPCLMCAGAILQARIKKLVFGTFEPKGGVFGSLYNVADDIRFNHKIKVISGILAEECRNLMQDFFLDRRCGEVPKWP